MKTMKRPLAIVMTIAMILSLFAGVGIAFADNPLSLTLTDEGDALRMDIVVNAECPRLLGIRFKVTVPEGFTFNSQTHYSGFSILTSSNNGEFYLDNTEADGITIPAGTTLLSLRYFPDTEEPGDYVFTVEVTEAADADFEEITDLMGATASAVYTIEDVPPATLPPVINVGSITAVAVDQGDTVAVSISLDEDANVSGIRFSITPPEGFTYQSESHYAGFSCLRNTDNTDFYLDNTNAEGIDIPAGAAVLTVVYTVPENLAEGDYTFPVEVTEAFDCNFEHLNIKDVTAEAVYTVLPAPVEPTLIAEVSENENTVLLTISAKKDYDRVAGIRFAIDAPAAFTYQSESHYAGFASLRNTDNTEFFIDNSEAEGINVPAYTPFLTIVYSFDALTECEHTFTVTVTEAADADFVDFADLLAAPATTVFVKHDWDAPTYEWAEDYSSVTATRVCKNDPSHTETETAATVPEVTKAATCEENGETTYTATFENTAFETQIHTLDNIPALGHMPGEVVIENETAATCETTGSYDEVVYCTVCGKELSRETVDTPALGHDWGTPSYSWAADNSTVTATRVCKNDPLHIETETVNTTSEVTKAATCTAKGETTYTATFTNEAFTTQTNTVDNIPALGHDWNAPNYSWAADNSTVTATRTCKNDPSHIETETVNTTSEVTKAATCTAKGETTYTATFTNAAFATQTKTVDNIPALGHDWNTPTYTWTKTGTGYTVAAKAVCKHDASHTVSESVTASYQVITPATGDTEGLGRYTATFTKSPFTTQTKDVVLPKLGYKITVTDKTNGNASTSIDQTKYYNSTVNFTVTSDAYDHAVVVFVKNGNTYTRLTCTTTSGVHNFSVEVKAPTEIVIAFKGDANLDGELKALDGTMIKRVSLNTYTLPSELHRLVCDLNGDGQIKSLEGTQVSRTALNTYKIPW